MVTRDTHVPENSVPITEDKVDEALVWVKAYTPSYITNVGEWDAEYDAVIYYFFFHEKRDVTAFSLRWL